MPDRIFPGLRVRHRQTGEIYDVEEFRESGTTFSGRVPGWRCRRVLPDGSVWAWFPERGQSGFWRVFEVFVKPEGE